MRPRSDPKRNALIVTQYQAGDTLQVIGDRLKLSRERIRQIVKAAGVPTRGNISHAKLEAVALMVFGSDTLTLKEAAQSLGISYGSATWYMRQRHPGWSKRRADENNRARLLGVGVHTCSHCGQMKPWSEFSYRYDRGGRYTRAFVCRPCSNRGMKEWAKRNRQRTPVPTVTERRCPRCKQTKPAAEFHRRQSASDGLQTYCKTCNRKYAEVASLPNDPAEWLASLGAPD